jgi:hypothetical protein
VTRTSDPGIRRNATPTDAHATSRCQCNTSKRCDRSVALRTCRWCFTTRRAATTHQGRAARTRAKKTPTTPRRARSGDVPPKRGTPTRSARTHAGRTFPAQPKHPTARQARPDAERRINRPLERQSPCSDAEAHPCQTQRTATAHPSPAARRRAHGTQAQTRGATTSDSAAARAPRPCPPLWAGGHGTHTCRVESAHKTEGCPEGNRSNRPQNRCPARQAHTGRRRERAVQVSRAHTTRNRHDRNGSHRRTDALCPHDRRTSRSVRA